ncbi:G-D-S-L family lipolytic protein [Flavobacterium sp.]|uniref:G-D-S-L family lipolytic protein n=1 Tax=Flavobacterium sp. TaxID=239 RepID=UPI0008D2529A|nr:G-D-S-L family lipolytic protein [Flavobacterium sp.]OGS63169.1 MAG: G-D-S-L family lipolytic protein [Flavobacteria bacterium GWF1_32_7]HBD26708.1 G-D-S-L family lipolytic protein [Flavobacterium sp.]
MKNKFIYLAILAAGFASCEPEFENEVNANYTSGDADFTTYVAVGNSLTAGYMDGTVSRGSQMNSYPNLLAQQFALVGGGEFTQPSYADDVNNLGGLMLGGIPIGSTRLVIDASEGRPENIAGTTTIEVSNLQATAYNNMGVPGAKSFHLLASGYGNIAGVALGQSNPYFVRHATSPSATVLGDAMSKNPTFFTNWIGANDVLSYATNGGAQSDGVTPAADHNTTGNMNPATYGGNDITNSTVFASVYSTIVNTLISGGAKGVVATVPSVTSIPYFTTVPYNALPAEATSSNATAISLYQFLAVATGGRISPLNTAAGTKNPVLIKDADLTDIGGTIQAFAAGSGNPLLVANAAALGAIYGQARHATSNDLVVLPASSIIGQPNASATAPFNINGVTWPLANKWVLTANEKAKVANATASYNAAIVSIANANDLAVADMNAIMNQLVTGLRIEDGTIYTANYFSSATASSVLFSLDGVHPNAKGYAVITNEIIKVINSHYNANLPFVYASSFPGATILLTN